ncbi:MAG TPA: LPD38 domain-containing protein [Planctomycetota bacterium]|nr:LPD38 domain-containing protein [Planctomycetota bacterium]
MRAFVPTGADGARVIEELKQLSQVKRVIENPAGAPGAGIPHMRPGVTRQLAGGRKPIVSAPGIVKDMERITGQPIRVGKGWFAQRKAAGWFNPRTESIRIKEANDLDVAAHEVGHALQKKMLLWNVRFPRGVVEEMLALGHLLYGARKPHGGYMREGFAEYVAARLWGQDVATLTPLTHYWFEDSLLRDHPDLRQPLDDLQARLTAWNQQGSIARVASQINRIQRGPVAALKRGWETLSFFFTRRAWTDFAAPLEVAQRKLIKQGGLKPEDINPEMKPYEVLAATRMTAPGTARHFVMKAAINTGGTAVGPSLKDVLQPVWKRIEDFLPYAYARRAQVLLARGINPGISQEDADYTVQQLDSPEFDEAVKGLTQWSDYLLDYVVESGGLSREAADAIRLLNPIYLPLKVFFDETFMGGSEVRGKRGVVDQPKAVLRIKGSGRQKIDPLEAFVQQAEFMIKLGNKLQVGKAMVSLAERVPGSAWFAEKVQPPTEAHPFKLEDIARELEAMGVDLGGADLDQILTVFNTAARYTGRQNIVVIWRDGKRQFWEINPKIYQVLTDMDREFWPAWMMTVAAPASRAMKLGATGLSAPFALVKNPLRDVQTWNVYAEAKHLTPLAAMRGLWEELRDTDIAQLYSAAGGHMTTFLGMDRATTVRTIEEAMASGVKGKGLMYARHPLDAMRGFFSAFESGPRISEFKDAYEKAAKKWGRGSRGALIEAILAGKDSTVDFTRAGLVSMAINQLVPFFNPQVQSMSKFYRAFKKHKVLATARAFTWITLPSIALWWAYKDEDWWKELPAWAKYGTFNISPDGGKTIIRIPGAFELHYVFGALPVAALDAAYQSAVKKNDTEAARSISDATMESIKGFLPVNVESQESFILSMTPQFGKPLAEVGLNWSEFQSHPIIPPYEEEQKELKDIYREYTTETAKAIAKAFNVSPVKVSPMQVEHLLSGYTGGLGLNAVRWSETVAGIGKKRKDRGLADIPVAGALFGRSPFGPRSASVQEMYDVRERLRKKKGSGTATQDELLRLGQIEYQSLEIARLKKKALEVEGREEIQRINREITDRARVALGKERLKKAE